MLVVCTHVLRYTMLAVFVFLVFHFVTWPAALRSSGMTESQNYVVFLHGRFPFFTVRPDGWQRARLIRALMQVVELHFPVGL